MAWDRIRWWTVITLGTVISLLLLWLAFRQVSLAEVGAALARADLLLMLVAMAAFLATQWAKALRWRVLFGQSESVPATGKLFSLLFVGQMINALVPIRLGELARAYLVGSARGVTRAQALGTIVVEKATDSAILLLVALGVSLATPLPAWLKASSLTVSVGLTLVLVGMMIGARARTRLPAWAGRWTGAGSWLDRTGVTSFVRRLMLGIQPLGSVRANLALWAWSVVIWALMTLTNLLALLGMGIHLPLAASVLLLVTLNLGIMLPSAPARVGVFHYVCVVTLALFGVDAGVALSFGIALHAIVHIPLFLGGGAGLAAENLSLTRLARLTAPADSPVRFPPL